MEEKQWKGMGLAIMGALFWGLSGTSVQFLESAKHINVEWLLEVRLLIAGILTIGLAYIRDGKRIFSIFKEPKDIGKLLIFGILGIALAQYTYFRAIAISGVGVATVLQYVAPTMIIIYLFLRYFKKPSIPELFWYRLYCHARWLRSIVLQRRSLVLGPRIGGQHLCIYITAH